MTLISLDVILVILPFVLEVNYMINKDIAKMSYELINFMIKIYGDDIITKEVFLKNTLIKVQYLEDYIKKNDSVEENSRIKQLLNQYYKLSAQT